MAKEVILTPIAESDYDHVIDYLTFYWGITVVNNFVNRFEKVLLVLSEDAGRFPFVDKAKNMQKCMLTKHNILYFIETDQTVKIVTVFDTRQDPKKLSSII
jgi:plasmid stabilization system protein ParE